MRFGLTSEQYDYIYRTAVEPLEAKGASVWCFGSRARGDHRRFSDLDLMVETSSDLSREISAIAERLQEGSFPFKVDIVALADFADSYRRGYARDKARFSPPEPTR